MLPHGLHLHLLLVLLPGGSIVYLVLAIRATASLRHAPVRTTGDLPPVTVLKPVCGLEPNLYHNLRSFCVQSHPCYQVIFGVASADDPAVPIIEALLREFPQHDLALVIDERVTGPNRKVSNLANMLPRARHDLLVMADSDMQVGPDYLATVAASFADPTVGAATCLYAGVPGKGLASVLGASFINYWFVPSVLVALSLGELRFCFGATMAVRREVLERIGGLEGLATVLADDYLLGNRVSAAGHRVALVPYVVRAEVHEPGVAALFRHELRWARTVRSVRPLGYGFSGITHAIPMALLYLAVAPGSAAAHGALVAAVGLRAALHVAVARRLPPGRAKRSLWLLPARDAMCFVVWLTSFVGRGVRWRQHRYTVCGDELLAAKEAEPS